jgi:uncharacterized protein (TIGR03118 family)
MKTMKLCAHRPSRFRSSRRRRFPAVDRLETRSLLATLTPVNTPINPVEGQSFTGLVARFTDSDNNTGSSQYSAQIAWGDGSSSTVKVVADPVAALGFDVIGTHTFREDGPVSVTVNITDADGDSASVRTTSIVADAPFTSRGVAVDVSRSGAVNNAVVATFNDSNPFASASDFTARINWGDNTTSTGTILSGPKGHTGFAVLGSHQYHGSGPFAIQVSVLDGGPSAVTSQFYTPINLVSDGLVPADHIDSNLVNPWGIVATAKTATSNGSPFWVSDNGTGVSTLYDGTGTPLSLVVTIPGPKTPPAGFTNAAPTGDVAGVAGEFLLPPAPTKTSPASSFIFATEDGTISGWNPNSVNGSAEAVLKVDNSTQVYANGGVGAVYKGIAIANNGGSDFLYATNFRSGNVDVFDTSFTPVTIAATAFHDPLIPAGYAPFGIQTLNGNLYVTFAKQNSEMHDDVAGAGNGFVDVFSPFGALLQKIGGSGTQTEFNSPWGLALAPSNFGTFSNDLLVGNFGDSHVSAFDPVSGAFLGQLSDAQGRPLVLLGGFPDTSPNPKGLWGIRFGNGGGSGPTNTLFFTAGINDESDGLLGAVTANTLSTAAASSVASVPVPVVLHKKGHP